MVVDEKLVERGRETSEQRGGGTRTSPRKIEESRNENQRKKKNYGRIVGALLAVPSYTNKEITGTILAEIVRV